MLLGIDHLVIAVESPDAAADALARDLGLAVTGGGRHEAMGTHNRLAFLGDTYLELIGAFDRDLVRSSTAFAVGNAAIAHLDAYGEGLATYALATDDLAGDVHRLRAAGSPVGGAVPGARVRPDGDVVRWSCAFPALGPARPPFLIEHAYQGAEWGPEARAARGAFRHPGGGRIRLAALELPVRDVAATAREYATTLGTAFGEGWRTTVGPHEVRLREGVGAPVVTLDGEPGTEALEVLRLGVLWRRTARPGPP